MSMMFMRVFAPHMNTIARSRLGESKPPIGALGLACAAVRLTSSIVCLLADTIHQIDIAFNCYSTGMFVAPTDTFDVALAGDLVEQYLTDTIVPMQQRKDGVKFFRVIETTRQLAPSLKPNKASAASAPKRRRRIIADSSSPVRPDSD